MNRPAVKPARVAAGIVLLAILAACSAAPQSTQPQVPVHTDAQTICTTGSANACVPGVQSSRSEPTRQITDEMRRLKPAPRVGRFALGAALVLF
ncbi:MAG: hypothetical protein AAGE13_03255 [Pseudomonadota bacterium]